jgi:hypothetical protein
MNNMDLKKCAHENCNCPAGSASSYCSLACESAKGSSEGACACGHPGCATADLAA